MATSILCQASVPTKANVIFRYGKQNRFLHACFQNLWVSIQQMELQHDETRKVINCKYTTTNLQMCKSISRGQNLIGKMCFLLCKLINVHIQALQDTGAQASIMNESWRQPFFPPSQGSGRTIRL